MKTRVLQSCSILLALLLVAVACVPVTETPAAQPAAAPEAAASQAAPAAGGELPRNETVYIGGFQWGPPTTFNPMAGSVNWPASGNQNLLYESLYAFNLLTGQLDPLLAKELTFTDQGTAIVALQPDTKWQDGEALTTDDILFTYGLAKDNPDLPFSTFWDYVSDMQATADRTIELTLNPERVNPGMVRNYLCTVRILPKHVWEARLGGEVAISQFVDTEPIGSGPYKVLDFSAERIAVERDDNYWGKAVYGLPVPKYVVHPIFKSNDDGNLALQTGALDLSQQFVPQIWLMWEEKGQPVGTWFKEEPFYVPGGIPFMFINLHKPGLENPLVRRAIAYAINYPLIAATAMSRYSVPVSSSLIVPKGGEDKYFDAEAIKANGWEYDPAKAVEILENELKATKGSDGTYVLPDGTRLGPWKVICPYGWTDWMTALEVVAQSAKEVGIDISTEFPDSPVCYSKTRNGDFDLTLFSIAAATPASPWLRFRDVLDDRGLPEFGTQAFWNYCRYSNPAVYDLLDQAATETDEATLKGVLGELDKIYMADIPGIGLMYRPLEFYEFNESVWTGFPTSENPWAPPQHQHAGIRVLFGIKPK